MRSPVGELLTAVRSIRTRPRDDAPVPYVAQRDTNYSSGGILTSTNGDPLASIEAFGTNGTLFAIVTKLAQGTASVDWHMHQTGLSPTSTCDICGSEDDAPRGVRLVDTHPALSVWARPNDFFTPMLFTETFEQHLDLVGEAWWVVVYLGGRPIELWPVRPDRMAPVRDPQKFVNGYVYRAPDGQLIPLRLDEVVMLRTPAPWDPYRGAGAVQTLMSNIRGAAAAAEWNRVFFQNSALPGGVIELPVHLQEPEWLEFQQRWAESHRGVRNAHTVAVLEHGGKWVDTKYSQRDMEFSELRRVNREEIREAFAMHGHVLGLSEDINRANAEAGAVTFARWQIKPRLDRIKDALNGPYLRLFKEFGKGYAFAYANPVATDRTADDAERTSKASAYKTYIEAGVDPSAAAQVCGLPDMAVAGDKRIGDPRAVAELIQKIYLGVGVMLDSEEARNIANRAGAGLPAGPMPVAPPPPAAPAPGGGNADPFA